MNSSFINKLRQFNELMRQSRMKSKLTYDHSTNGKIKLLLGTEDSLMIGKYITVYEGAESNCEKMIDSMMALVLVETGRF